MTPMKNTPSPKEHDEASAPKPAQPFISTYVQIPSLPGIASVQKGMKANPVPRPDSPRAIKKGPDPSSFVEPAPAKFIEPAPSVVPPNVHPVTSSTPTTPSEIEMSNILCRQMAQLKQDNGYDEDKSLTSSDYYKVISKSIDEGVCHQLQKSFGNLGLPAQKPHIAHQNPAQSTITYICKFWPITW